MRQPILTKPMYKMLIAVTLLFGGIFLYKVIMNQLMQHWIAAHSQSAITVSAIKATYAPWQSTLQAAGSVRAINGVNVTTELPGLIEAIYIKPGTFVAKGTPLVQLNIETEKGQLTSLKASAELANLTYQRDQAQLDIGGVSQQTVDTDRQNLKNLRGQIAQQLATMHKKTIRAPFSGYLGINNVNLGQYLNAGDRIVMLQSLNPLLVDFYLPQQYYNKLRLGQPITIATAQQQPITGLITTINPAAEVTTRNIQVEATIPNLTHQLIPGMFVDVTIETNQPKNYLTLPQTAISFNPYGSIAYLISEAVNNDHGNQPHFKVKQVFVKTGETRGDQVTILQGIKEGDRVVTAGQLKLTNGSIVTIDNRLMPPDEANPPLPNEH